ncbi:tetratricopeptide repeat protein [Acetobacter fallax]|uniref:Tetratricopeptide repeat protein n=1 Tax=Acetobacter fallax TaxID=1737473 RepID=A0ABX0KBY0_9PROT|nr:tetratricopeptide repeat-containing glycosyltransferase family protein [Acetobacter fallax]NHO31472.1 tetratricopeptide repeat protein [Acetobacter fallax]NHO34944.1 tetratricopeptide repeat protein [Acetobacter fallax]
MTIRSATAEVSDTLLDTMLARCRVFEQRRDFEAVRRDTLRFLGRHPRDMAALALLGRAELRLGRPARALAPLGRCFRQSGNFVFRLLYAHCLRKLGCQAEATAELEQTSRMMPASGFAFFTAGVAFEGIGETDRAVRFYRQSLELAPDVPCVSHRLGRLLLDQGEPEAALDLIARAIAARPEEAYYHLDHGVALELTGRLEESLQAVEKALALKPQDEEALHNRSHLLSLLNQSDAAIIAADRALEVRPAYPKTLFTRATALLKAGRWDEGWREYEWRWRSCQTPRMDLCAPLWLGEDLRGRSILLHAEQGFGDSLQFIRFATSVSRCGARVTVQVPEPLVRLFRRVEGIADVCSTLPSGCHFDFHSPLGSLPLRFGIMPDTVPGAPYLSVPPGEAVRQGDMVRRLVENGGADARDFVVGLVWSGAPRRHKARSHALDRRRSVKLAELAPLFSVQGTRFVSFQMDEAATQRAESGFPLTDVTGGIGDFADTAARLSGVDLLITVDTSIAHLGGGLGLPVLMLSRFDSCWRWLEGRSDTPWYPSMRVIRQSAPGDWSGAVEEARSLLSRHMRDRSCALRP